MFLSLLSDQGGADRYVYGGEVDIYRSSFLGVVSIGSFAKYCFNSWKALSHSSFHSNSFPPFRVLKNGRQRSTDLVNIGLWGVSDGRVSERKSI